MPMSEFVEVPGFLAFGTALACLMGANIGSFLNVCIYRIPRDESVVAPRSKCTRCDTPIPWYHNIPILSWTLLRGKSACCQTPITARYVTVEALVAVLFLMVWLKWVNGVTGSSILGLGGLTHAGLIPVYWLFVSGLVIGTFVDFEHMIIPDRVTLGGIVAGVLLSALVPALHNADSIKGGLLGAAIGAAVGWGILWGIATLGAIIFKKEAMGFGDVKLLGCIGAFIGWPGVLFTIFGSSLAGSIAGLSLIGMKKKELQSRIPYGPYLALAALVWMYWGPALTELYIDLMTPDISHLY